MAITVKVGTAKRDRQPRGNRLVQTPRRVYAVLLAIIAGSAFPLYWSLVVGSNTTDVVNQSPPPLLPGGHLFANIAHVFRRTAFGRALLNSLIVSTSITVSVVFFCTLAGFVFAKLAFRGRNVLLLLIIATMMVPMQLGIVPQYILMSKLGWANHLQAVVVPSMVTAFGVFFMRQYLSELTFRTSRT